jgi:hypothetical protein
LGTEGPLPAMMTADEQTAYSSLPEEVRVYRGCGPGNIKGASWSLDRSQAERFPRLIRYWSSTPLLVTATVAKANILAVKLGRDEHEVITFSARRTSIEHLPVETQK